VIGDEDLNAGGSDAYLATELGDDALAPYNLRAKGFKIVAY